MKTKKLIIIISIFAACSVMAGTVRAESPPTATPADVLEKIKQIEALKEKIATTVAEIRNKDKTATAGIIKKIDKDSITIQNRKGEGTIVYSEDTTFYSLADGEKKEATSKKITEGDTISVFGYFSDDKLKISAKYIFLHSPALHILGKIVDIDKENYTITVKDKQGDQVVDIETSTKVSLFVKNKGWQKGGFSKFKTGDSVHVNKKGAREEARIVYGFLRSMGAYGITENG